MSAALDGVTILDFSRFLPGAYPGWIAGDLGADVIRVEHPREVAKAALADPAAERRRRARPSYQRNKRSITLNPTHPKARTVLDALLARADILVEDYRPGTMAAMGLGYTEVSERHPHLIFCSVSFAGQDGPLAGKAGHDPGGLALAGALSRLNGTARPTLPGVQVADVLAGAHATIAVLAALRARDRTGRGTRIDVAMSDACLPLTMVALGRTDDPSSLGPSDGAFHPKGGVWKCADGAFLCTTDMELPYWRRFCAAIGREDLTSWRETPARWPDLEGEIADTLAARPRAAWLAIFEAADTQATPVLSPAEALNSALMRARGMAVTLDTRDGPVTQVGTPFRLGDAAPDLRVGTLAGSDTDVILAELGFSPSETAELQVSGLFTSTERR
jgi:alpha-methylacyl-CoA racemase